MAGYLDHGRDHPGGAALSMGMGMTAHITKKELKKLKKKSRLLPTRNAVKLSRLPKKAKVKEEKP